MCERFERNHSNIFDDKSHSAEVLRLERFQGNNASVCGYCVHLCGWSGSKGNAILVDLEQCSKISVDLETSA